MRSFLRLGLCLFLFTTLIDPGTAAAATVDVTGSLVYPALPISVVAGVRFNIAARR